MDTILDLPRIQLVSCGELACEMLVNPIPRPTPTPFTVTTRPARRGVVMVDHHKPNSAAIQRRAKAMLEAAGVEVEMIDKPSSSNPMPEALCDRLAAAGGLVLCGVSDCGSCSASSSVDAIMLQQRGAAGIAVLTGPFAMQIDRAMAYQTADRPLPAVIVDHPMQNIDDEALERRARQLADGALRLLDGSTDR